MLHPLPIPRRDQELDIHAAKGFGVCIGDAGPHGPPPLNDWLSGPHYTRALLGGTGPVSRRLSARGVPETMRYVEFFWMHCDSVEAFLCRDLRPRAVN